MKKAFSLLPFLIFLTTFSALNFIYPNVAPSIKDDFPIFAAFVAIIVAFFTFKPKTSLNDKINVFVQGAAQPLIIHMCFIFLISTVFTHVLEKIGGVQAMVNISLQLISSSFILPGMFVVSSLFSFAIGSSMGTIAAFMPIASAIALQLTISPEFMAGTIVCGAMFGDNLSILSDTTIAAVQITGSNMKEKIKANAKIALPASLLTIILLCYVNQTMTLDTTVPLLSSINDLDFIKIIPYITAFGLALYGLDILAVLSIGTIVATGIGLYLHNFTFVETTNFLFNGFYQSKGMVAVFILILFLAGLSKIVEHNGGIEYLLQRIQQHASSTKSIRLSIFILVSAVNVMVAINTISILITGPIANKLGANKVNRAEIATILDLGSCITQGVLPYAPQILLATSMSSISPLSIMPYLYYQYILLTVFLIDIVFKKH